ANDEVAELGARAARHLGPAGERALARGDLAAAASFLERASEMVDDADPARPELLASLGMAQAAPGELDAAERVLGGAVEPAETRGDRRTRERAAVEATRIRLITGEAGADEAHAVATAATGVLATLDDDLGLAKAWLLLAFVHNWHLEFSAMERAAREA